ncbi:hypothetical protein [Pseudomonas batumici]|uniref:hypothetical protein n=1 Tax=Pseudomonas batumici TaxID=226910 RepID=UPI0012EEA110|nr:hypothetical protein [Pseudomonas batumici]
MSGRQIIGLFFREKNVGLLAFLSVFSRLAEKMKKSLETFIWGIGIAILKRYHFDIILTQASSRTAGCRRAGFQSRANP